MEIGERGKRGRGPRPRTVHMAVQDRARGGGVWRHACGVWVSGDEEMEISITHRALT